MSRDLSANDKKKMLISKPLKLIAMICLSVMIFVFNTSITRAAKCETLKGEIVGFGEDASRRLAEEKLAMAIADWETRRRRTANPEKRETTCKVYIDFLNEFECTAEVVVCR